jgi:hypothetical protein
MINLRAELQKSVSCLQNQKCITAVSLSMLEIISKAALHISAVVYLLCSSSSEGKSSSLFIEENKTVWFYSRVLYLRCDGCTTEGGRSHVGGGHQKWIAKSWRDGDPSSENSSFWSASHRNAVSVHTSVRREHLACLLKTRNLTIAVLAEYRCACSPRF